MVTPLQRRNFLQSLPYVKYLEERSPCDGVRWGKVPLKAVLGPTPSLDKYRCRTPAHWRFKALTRSDAKSGVYCMTHLLGQLQYPEEDDRVDRYWDKFIDPKAKS